MALVKIFSHELISDKILREFLWILLDFFFFFSKRKQENDKNEGEMKLKLMYKQNKREKCKEKKKREINKHYMKKEFYVKGREKGNDGL